VTLEIPGATLGEESGCGVLGGCGIKGCEANLAEPGDASDGTGVAPGPAPPRDGFAQQRDALFDRRGIRVEARQPRVVVADVRERGLVGVAVVGLDARPRA